MRKGDKIIIILLLAFAVCCELYGIKVFLAGSGTAFFAIWLIIGLIFAVLAYAVKRSVWKRLPRTVRKIICILLCIGILFFAVVEGCIMSRFFDKGTEDLDYIIVLGAQVYENGPSPILNGIASYTPVVFSPNNLLREFFGVLKF